MKLPKSFVAIDLSEKDPDAFPRRTNGKGKELADSSSSGDEKRGRPEEKQVDAAATSEEEIPVADVQGTVVPPSLQKEITPTELPPPVTQDL